MSSATQHAQLAGLAARETVAGVDAVYRRGDASVALRVVPGRGRADAAAAAGGLSLGSDQLSYIIRAASIDFGAGPAAPAEGDVIEALGRRAEVMSPGGGLPAVSRVDDAGAHLRVTCRPIGGAA